MRCHACSAENPDGYSFCEGCGARLGISCLQCGYRNSPSARFCGSCGDALGIIEAELKFATVMFADVVASTALIGGLYPEQARGRLQPTVAVMSAVVKRFDGTVVRTLGDGIMAFFEAQGRKRDMRCLPAKPPLLCTQSSRMTKRGRQSVSDCIRAEWFRASLVGIDHDCTGAWTVDSPCQPYTR